MYIRYEYYIVLLFHGVAIRPADPVSIFVDFYFYQLQETTQWCNVYSECPLLNG